MNTPSKTSISKVDNIKVSYIEKGVLIFTWREIVKTESIGKDLVITTTEDYNRIILNGKEISFII